MANVSLDLDSDCDKKSKILKKCNSEVSNYFRSVFNCIDTNEDGIISYAELKTFLDSSEDCNIPERVVTYVYAKFDTNKDDQLEFEEFLEMVIDPVFKSMFEKVAERIFKYVVIQPMKHKRVKLERTITLTGTYERECRCYFNVVGMTLISILQVILFYVNKSFMTDMDKQGPLTAALKFDPCRKLEVYRYITYIFTHSDNMHLYGNVVIQILIGILLEMVHSWRVILVYCIGSVGGCVTHSVFDRTSGLRGASGGVYSVYTAHIAAVIMNWREMSHPAVHFLLFGIIISVSVIYDITQAYGQISYLAHTGGAVVGLLVGVIILRNLRETKNELILRHVCGITFGLLVLTFTLLDICLPMEGDCTVDTYTIQPNISDIINML